MNSPYRLAAIDVGTNSFHLIVASVVSNGVYQVLSRDKENVRLGEGFGDMKHISDDAILRAIEALKRFKGTLTDADIPIRAVATSAVREALNKEDFLRTVYAETGISVEVISGPEEARLIYLGVLQALPIYDKRTFVIDIGGGSTETVVGLEGKLLHVHSAKLGAIRLSKQFFQKEKTTLRDIKLCREHICGEWNHVFQEVQHTPFEFAVGCSGTIENIFSMAMAMRNEQQTLPVPNATIISEEEVYAVIERLIKADTVKKRADIPGLDIKRADIILGGALILEQMFRNIAIPRLTFSTNALREGILFDSYQKAKNIQRYHHLSRLRYDSILRLCQLYNVNLPHAEKVKELAVQIFDALIPLTGFGDAERELLEAAAYLHDVGYIISSDQHHKHSYYIITNSNMLGFTVNETEIIGNIARYHRKSHPKNKHDNYKKVKPRERTIVEVLAGILRIAEGLDRRQQQAVEAVSVRYTDTQIEIAIHVPSGEKASIEMWGADRKKSLLEERLARTVVFSVRTIKG